MAARCVPDRLPNSPRGLKRSRRRLLRRASRQLPAALPQTRCLGLRTTPASVRLMIWWLLCGRLWATSCVFFPFLGCRCPQCRKSSRRRRPIVSRRVQSVELHYGGWLRPWRNLLDGSTWPRVRRLLVVNPASWRPCPRSINKPGGDCLQLPRFCVRRAGPWGRLACQRCSEF